MYTEAEIKSAGLDDFRMFLAHAWAFLLLPAPTRVQRDIAKWLQRGPRRLILQAFRGVGKSWITAAFVCWCLLLNPQLKIMVVSANQQTADDISKFIKQLIHGMPVLQHLAPRADQRNSGISFDVGPATPSKDPSVKSVGITGQLTGSRADIIIGDDIEIPKNSLTHLMRERLSELVKEFDAILKPGGRVIYLGTPQIENSLYVRLQQRGYETRIWPAEIPVRPSAYQGRLAPFVQRMIDRGAAAEDPVDPERFSKEDLMERKASYGLSGYALQFMLDTSPSDQDAHPLKLRDLMVLDCDPQMGHVSLAWGASKELVLNDLQSGGYDGDCYHRPAFLSPEMAKFTQTVMAIDPSGRGKDETGYAIVKYLHGMLYLVDVGGFVDGFGEDTMRTLAGKALRWGVNDIVIETNYGGGMFNKLLEPWLVRVFAEAVRPDDPFGGPTRAAGKIDEEWNGWSSTMKENRIIDTLLPVLQNHKVVVDRRVIEEDLRQQQDQPKYSFVQQLTRMERIKGALPHEDRLEAFSMCVSYLTEKMNRDQQRAQHQHREALKDQELRRFAKHVIGVGRRPAGEFHVWAGNNWTS